MPSPRISPIEWLLAVRGKRLRHPSPPVPALSTNPPPEVVGGGRVPLLAPGHVDGDPGDEGGLRRGKEAYAPGLVLGGGPSPERRAPDLGGLPLRRAPVPVRADPLGEGEAGRDGIDGDPVGSELEGELAGERDD